MRSLFAMLLAFAPLAPVVVHAQSDRSYDIMRPEPGRTDELPTPWLPPKYRSPRGSHNRVEPVPQQRPRYVAPRTPPPLVVPQTGQVVPQSPVISRCFANCAAEDSRTEQARAAPPERCPPDLRSTRS